MLTDESRRALIEAAATHDAWIIADEVYAGAELDGRQTASFFGSYPRVVATGSLSKAYGLPGLRIGWAVSTPDMIGELWARRDYTTIAPATPSDRLATLALEPGVRARLLERTRRHIRDGITVLEAWLEEQQLFTWQRPAAGAICLATFTAPVDTSQLAERLRVEQSVLVVPGEQFGVPNAIRLGFSAPAAAADRARPYRGYIERHPRPHRRGSGYNWLKILHSGTWLAPVRDWSTREFTGGNRAVIAQLGCLQCCTGAGPGGCRHQLRCGHLTGGR